MVSSYCIESVKYFISPQIRHFLLFLAISRHLTRYSPPDAILELELMSTREDEDKDDFLLPFIFTREPILGSISIPIKIIADWFFGESKRQDQMTDLR